MKMGNFWVFSIIITILAFTFTACGEEETRKREHEHQWNIYYYPSTCSTAGTEYKTCVVCFKETLSTMPIDPNNHISWYFNDTVERTCDTVVKGEEVCFECNAKREIDLPPLGHSWGIFSETVGATCTITGIGKYNCVECNIENPEEYILSELGHWWGEMVITKDPTCTTDGELEQSCIREGCTVPDKNVIVFQKLGHKLSVRTILSSTCFTSGRGEETCINSGCTLPAREFDTPIRQHNYVSNVQPLCTDDQIVTGTCTECSSTGTIKIERKEHNWDNLSNVRTCLDCNIRVNFR